LVNTCYSLGISAESQKVRNMERDTIETRLRRVLGTAGKDAKSKYGRNNY
jgi:hypothetical protein